MPVPGTHAPATSPPVVQAFAANAPAALGAELRVRIPSFGNALSTVKAWTPSYPLPVKEDECLVAFDERGDPSVVAWVKAQSRLSLVPPLVSTLPAEPVDGQEVYFQNAALYAQHVIWHMRYLAASGNWIFVGGAPWVGFGGDITTASSAMVALTSGPTFTAPLSGEYTLDMAVSMVPTGPGFNVCSVFANEAETACTALVDPTPAGASQHLPRAQSIPYGVAAGTVFSLRVQSLSKTNTRFVNATLLVTARTG